MHRHRTTSILLFSVALSMFGIALIVVDVLHAIGGIAHAFDGHAYVRLCPAATEATCLALSGWQLLAIGLVAIAIGSGLVVAAIRRWRSGAATSR